MINFSVKFIKKYILTVAVLRIHLILIRILDPHWKKMDNFLKIYWIFFTKKKLILFKFFAYFYSKTWWTIKKRGNFYNLFFLKFIFGFYSFWWIFYPLGPDPWISTFLRIRIRIEEAKSCGSRGSVSRS